MRWPWQKRQEPAPTHPADDRFAQLWSAEFPPIPPEEREAARKRLADPGPVIMIDLGDGPSPFYTGTVNADDYTKRDGYLIVPEGFDRWGYRIDADGKGEGG